MRFYMCLVSSANCTLAISISRHEKFIIYNWAQTASVDSVDIWLVLLSTNINLIMHILMWKC